MASGGEKRSPAMPSRLRCEQANDAQQQKGDVADPEKHRAAASLLHAADDDLLGSKGRAGEDPAIVVDQGPVASRC